MKELKNFIDKNYSWLSENIVKEMEVDPNTFGPDILDFLKQNERFDYKGICVYYVSEEDMIWIESMEY